MAVASTLTALLKKVRGGNLAGELFRAGLGSVAVKVGSTFLRLALAVVLARTLGAEGYGTYAYVFAAVSLISTPVQLGLPRLVVRETAKAQVSEDWGLMRGLWRWTSRAATSMSIALACSIYLFFLLGWFGNITNSQMDTLFFGLALMPLVSLLALKGAALQGLRRMVLGKLPDQVLRPGAFVILVLAACSWSPTLTASGAMGLHVLAAAMTLAVSTLTLNRLRPLQLGSNPAPIIKAREWIGSALPMAMVVGMLQISQQADLLLIGVFRTATDVGVYRVAVQGAMLVVFGLHTVAMLVLPFCARLYAQSDHARLQKLVTIAARLSLLPALLMAIVFAVWGNPIINTFFGPEYTNAYMPLLVLAVGQVVSGIFGPVAGLLTMTGHERIAARGVACGAVVNVVLNILLIPSFGLVGAATATAITFCVWNLMLWRGAHKMLHIDCTCF